MTVDPRDSVGDSGTCGPLDEFRSPVGFAYNCLTRSARVSDSLQPGSIVLVEDDEGERDAVAAVLREAGHVVTTVASGSEVLALLGRRAAEVVVLDLDLPDIDGLELLGRLASVEGNATVVVLTGPDDIQTLVEAMKLGADGFLVKPVEVATLRETVQKALLQQRRLRRVRVYEEAVAARKSAAGELGAHEFVGSSPVIRAVRGMIGQVAKTDSSVVLSGESGTGKGVVAKLIHAHSRHPHGPFVGVSCAALPAALVESEIFGHERGAFTDAKSSKPGLLEVANGGTLFLDEIAELEPQAQAKLLKIIEERSFRRLGGVRDLAVAVRFVVATHQNLGELVRRGDFREDLFYRLNVFEIALPPLRERGDDVVELAYHFIRNLNPLVGREIRVIANPAVEVLRRYSWPGNVRELRNVIERAMILTSGKELSSACLPHDLRDAVRGGGDGIESLEEVEARHIARALRATGGNVKLAAQRLGISRSTMYAKLRRYSLAAPRSEGVADGQGPGA